MKKNNWKKVKDTKTSIIFQKERKKIIDGVFIQKIISCAFPTNKWRVTLLRRGHDTFFKTKTQALKFAHNYIRKY